MAEVHLSLTDAWRKRLLVVRSGQAVAAEVENLLEIEAVWLYGWMGNSAHLGLDGRVVGWGAAEGLPPEVVEDPENVARLITLGSHWLAIPELTDLLPPRPPGSVVCPYCDGWRWNSTPVSGYPEGCICFVCKGVGWRPASRVTDLPKLEG
jgi:hypothetical protein